MHGLKTAIVTAGMATACVDGQHKADTAIENENPSFFTVEEQAIIQSLTGLGAPPPDPSNAVADDPDAARLGQWLYFDENLSANGEVACTTCHEPALGFSDGLRISQGLGETRRHSISLWNNAYNRWFFWDGHCDTLWCQALKPLEHPDEMGNNRLSLAHHVHEDDALRDAYESIFGALPDLSDEQRFPLAARPNDDDPDDPLDIAWRTMSEDDQFAINVVFSNLGKAIAAYERLLITGEAPFDAYATVLRESGEDAARDAGILSASAERGLKIFVGMGNCHFCHAGPNFTNGEFHNIGLDNQEWLDPEDTGRYEGIPLLLSDEFRGTGVYSDDPSATAIQTEHLIQGPDQLGQFKVPSLRNVAQSPPYMHGGQLDTLQDVVRFYSELDQEVPWGHREELLIQLDLEDTDVEDVVAFLESLTGPGPGDALMQAPPSPQQ